MTLGLLLLLKVAVTAILFGIGLESTPGDMVRLLRRPSLLLRSLLAMYVAVPLAAFILVSLVSLPPGIEAGLLVLAVSAGAPLLPRKLLGVGDGGYVFSLVVISSLLAIVLVPAWLAILAPRFPDPPHLPPHHIAWVLAEAFFQPLVAGMIVRRYAPGVARRIGSRLVAVSGVALTLGGLALLAVHWSVLVNVGWNMGALAILVAASLAIGHLLGGPTEEERTALAIACATRHIGVALMVATSLPGPRTAVIIAAYIAVSAAISIPYLQWRRRTSAKA